LKLFEFSARNFFKKCGLNPDLGIEQISPGDFNPYFNVLVFIKTLGDLPHSQQTHRDLWLKIEKMFETYPPLKIFKEVVSLGLRSNEWAANIPGPDADDALKQRYSTRLSASLNHLARARADLKSYDPTALELWDRATQHPSVPTSDLNLQKLNETNFRRQIGSVIKLVLFLSCNPPPARAKEAHSALVGDLLDLLPKIPITDPSGKNRTMASFAPIVKHAVFDINHNLISCLDIASSQCSGDDVARLFALELDSLIWDSQANSSSSDELEYQLKHILKPLTDICTGRIGVADAMFEVDPVDPHTEKFLSRTAELCFPRYASTTTGRVCPGGQAQEKEKLVQKWSKVPEARRVLNALWKNPHDFEGAVRGVSRLRTVWFAKRIFSRCQKYAPLNSVEFFLEHGKVSMERIAYLRDCRYYD
jgi:hypothetical protein